MIESGKGDRRNDPEAAKLDLFARTRGKVGSRDRRFESKCPFVGSFHR